LHRDNFTLPYYHTKVLFVYCKSVCLYIQVLNTFVLLFVYIASKYI